VGDTSRGTFLDWRRDEPNNHSLSAGVSAGVPAAGGERCASLVPWQEDPLLQEQGSWNDVSCEAAKPFLCQSYGDTQRYTLTVTGAAALTGGGLEGGILRVGTVTGSADLLDYEVSRSGRLVVAAKATDCTIGTLLLKDGATLQLLAANAYTLSGAYIGEPQYNSPSDVPLQPFLRVGRNTTLSMGPLCADDSSPSCATPTVTIAARVFAQGKLVVTGDTQVDMQQVRRPVWLRGDL
jgi:hypothetical protein